MRTDRDTDLWMDYNNIIVVIQTEQVHSQLSDFPQWNYHAKRWSNEELDSWNHIEKLINFIPYGTESDINCESGCDQGECDMGKTCLFLAQPRCDTGWRFAAFLSLIWVDLTFTHLISRSPYTDYLYIGPRCAVWTYREKN